MKRLLIILLMCASAHSMASILHATTQFRGIKLDNNEVFQPAPVIASPSAIYFLSGISSSTDPFSSKTNKFAESRIVSIVANTPINIRFGTSSVGSAVTTDYYLPADTIHYFGIDTSKAFLRVINGTASASANVYVTEIY